MKKRIFLSTCLASIVVFAASVILFMCVLYNYFTGIESNQLKIQTALTAQAVANEGMSYFEDLAVDIYRITWVDVDGEVLYDSKSDPEGMENHLEREEIKEALASGDGESFRHSATLMERTLYCAKRLEDGTVIRLSVSHNTVLTLLLGLMQPICVIIVIVLILSFILASRLSKQIVNPLNELNLDEPLENDGYDELTPLLRRIDSQKRKIKLQSMELQRKQQEFEAVTENMKEGIILINSKGEVIGINRAAKQIFSADHSCVGQHILSVTRNMELTDLLSEAEKGLHTEKTITLPGGKYQLLISPVISDDTVSGLALLAINVTEKENAEQMRREFSANVSHELKTPLHTIAGSAELLLNGMVAEPDRMNFYKRIYEESERMVRLIEDIIRLSHLDEDLDDMKFEEVDIYALAEESVDELSPKADAANVTIALKGETAVASGVPQLLRSILYNLCDNAIKYNRAHGSVTVTVKNQPDLAVLSVADTGIGIAPEHQSRIFERFYRVDKSRSKELGGTGLGLSIVKHAAQVHKAEINIESVVNGGTTITISFRKSLSPAS